MKFINALVAAAVLSALAAAPVQADTVDVRIEGDGVSLQRTVEVPTGGEVFSGCPYDTAAGAIEVATEGNWDRSSFTSTILGESHTYTERDYWNFWYEREPSQQGICSQAIQDGDEVLMIVQREDRSGNPAVFPLFITSSPASVERGQEAQVTVVEHRYSYASPGSAKVRAEGATVSGCGSSATTGADGVATITCAESGNAELRASKPQRARSQRVPLVVTEPGQPAPPPPPPPAQQQERRPCFTNGADGRCGTRDLQAPIALITSIRTNARFGRRSAPRLLRGTAGILGANELLPDGSGILMIKLRLTRVAGGRCSTWSSRTERFVPRRCGAENGFWFKVATTPDWDYLLPARLGRGRYVLDADAIDRAGNRLRIRRRGENRVVFRVR